MSRNPNKKTRLAKIYDKDFMAVKSRFPDTSIAEMFHISLKTNPLLQMEAALRKKPKKK